MNTTLGVIMDPIESIKVQKDSTFAMLLAAQHRGWELLYMEQGDLSLSDGVTYARMRPLRVRDNASNWYQLGDQRQAPLDSLDVVLMRKDPPFDMEYIYTTYLLEQAEHRGCLVVNRPQALRDANEKLFTSEFNDCTPPTLVSRSAAEIRSFLDQHQDIILKPLGGMGGASVFRVRRDEPNTSVIIETLTLHGTQFTMAQQFIPEISAGDKRILMIDGEARPVRSGAHSGPRGRPAANLAAGGRGRKVNPSPSGTSGSPPKSAPS